MRVLILNLSVVLSLSVGCSRNLVQASDPYSFHKSDCAGSPVNSDCVTITESKIPGGAMGYGYPGAMAPMMTAGQQSLVAYPGAATFAPAPVATVAPTDVTTKKQGQDMGKAIIKNSKDICDLKKSQGKECK